MSKKLPSHLKLHTEDQLQDRVEPQGFDLAATLSAFTKATGWIPRAIHGNPVGSGPTGMNASAALGMKADREEGEPQLPLQRRVKLICDAPIDGQLDAEFAALESITSEEVAWQLLAQIDALVQKLDEAETMIREQEAALATSVGVSVRKDETRVLSSRINESLLRAAEQTGSDAAAVYLLDDTTSQLKMRGCWGMATDRLAKPPRDLRGSLGDLEALMGNAVLLENTALAREWQCPEDYAAAMCLPIGSPTMPQGTIWLFSDHVRDFSTEDIEAAKAASEKIQVDIERCVLADEVLKNRGIERQFDSAGLTQSSRLPSGSQLLHQDYDLAGWTFQDHSLGGNFHNWTMNRRSEICAAIGAATPTGAPGALVATSVQTVVETCWNSRHTPEQILRRANDVLWQAQDGDWRSSLGYCVLHPDSGSVSLAVAGSIQAFLVGDHGFRPLPRTETALAAQPDTSFRSTQLYLEAGEILVLASESVVAGEANGGLSQELLLQTINSLREETADDIVDHLARKLPLQLEHSSDRSLLILKRGF